MGLYHYRKLSYHRKYIPAILKLEKINFLRGRHNTATLNSCNEVTVSNFSHLDMHAYYTLLIPKIGTKAVI